MSYISKEKISALYSAEDVEDVTDERMTLIVAQTDELIDSYLALAPGVVLPLDLVPKLIEKIAVDVARWEIVSDDRIYVEEKFKGLQIRYDKALQLLSAIREGTLSLSATTNRSMQPNRSIQQNKNDRIFTMRTLQSF